mmetsp:Transcript_12619/g.21773  ORF Transcript_12619/g.21773 Transcript_12619/m.21773 type:complete len:269 (+) Transcript_12619:307-1113(+)
MYFQIDVNCTHLSIHIIIEMLCYQYFSLPLLRSRRRWHRPHKVMKRMLAHRPQSHGQPQTPRSRRPQNIPLVLSLRSIQRNKTQKAQYANGHRDPTPQFGIGRIAQSEHLGTSPNGSGTSNHLQNNAQQQCHKGKERERQSMQHAVQLLRFFFSILQYHQQGDVRWELFVIFRIQKVVGHGEAAILNLLSKDVGLDGFDGYGRGDAIELGSDEFCGVVELDGPESEGEESDYSAHGALLSLFLLSIVFTEEQATESLMRLDPPLEIIS